MIKSFSMYPHEINDEYIKKIDTTLELAYRYGFDEVFTSIHLPEYSLLQQLECLNIIAERAEKYHFDITVDIGGHYIPEVLGNEKYLSMLKSADVDFIRLDYGFDKNQVGELYKKINNRGFVVNASIYRKDEVSEVINNLKSLDEKLEIRACHNFYVRNETGIDETTAIRQDSYFKEYDMPVCYCIPSYSNPRGPLFEGLCTLEKHRHKTISEVLTDLVINYDVQYVMMADEWLSEDEFREFEETYEELSRPLNDEEEIHVKLDETVSRQEKNIVLNKAHVFRYDSPYDFLRSQSSRQMAELASVIRPGNTGKRAKGAITIDNERYRRYSGELQVVMTETESDDRVNVVGVVSNNKDLLKLRRFREGIRYRFVEDK